MLFTIGGKIGLSCMLMFLLEYKYIGEVQSSVWTDEMIQKAKSEKIEFLIYFQNNIFKKYNKKT